MNNKIKSKKYKRKKKFSAAMLAFNKLIKDEAEKENGKTENQRMQDKKSKKNAANKMRAKCDEFVKAEEESEKAKVEADKKVKIEANIKRMQKRHSQLARNLMKKSFNNYKMKETGNN